MLSVFPLARRGMARPALRCVFSCPNTRVLIALLVIAVGIRGNTAVFSVVDAVLLKPLTYPDSSPPMTFPRTTVAWRLPPRFAGLSCVIVDFFGTTSVHLSERKAGLLVPKRHQAKYLEFVVS
jgi:hypothetical protein